MGSSENHWCCNADAAEKRWEGSSINSFDKRSIPVSLRVAPPEKDVDGSNVRNLCPLVAVDDDDDDDDEELLLAPPRIDTLLKFGNAETPGQFVSVAGPIIEKIFTSWSISPLPVNKGRLRE